MITNQIADGFVLGVATSVAFLVGCLVQSLWTSFAREKVKKQLEENPELTCPLCLTSGEDIDEAVSVVRKDEEQSFSLVRDERERAIVAWVRSTFGEGTLTPAERAIRFFEEAVELLQAEGIHADRLADVVAHVYRKPPGDRAQEVGGVGLTLLAYCGVVGISAEGEEILEWERVQTIPADEFRKRHNVKAAAGIAIPTDAGSGT